jgi:O-antigen biosynthesis alpha-1,3-abequosyltransferase
VPDLSVCVPTHHGRATELATALDSVIAQLDSELAGAVEICVSDNASRDETQELIRERQRSFPGELRYERNPRDLGPSCNILKVAESAQGRWIWLLGSDDALEPGSLRGVLSVLRSNPGVVGASVGRRFYARDMSRALPLRDTEPPVLDGPMILADRALLDALGLYAMYMSTQIIDASAWRAARERVTVGSLARSIYPHAWVIASLWFAGHRWLWVPTKYVRTRVGNTQFGVGHYRSLDAMLARAVRDQATLWRAIGDRRNARRQLARLQQMVLPAGDGDIVVFRHLSYPARDRRGAVAMLYSCLRAFWWSAQFWRGSLRALLLVIFARWSPDRSMAAGRLRLERTEVEIRLESGSPPSVLRAEELWEPEFRVSNTGTIAIRSCPQCPLDLGARWVDSRTGEAVSIPTRVPIGGALGPGAERRFTLPLVAPLELGAYELRVSLLAEGIGWLEDMRPDAGWTCSVQLSPQDLA